MSYYTKPLTTPSDEISQMLDKCIGEDEFKKTFISALNKAKFNITTPSFGWRNLGIFSTFHSGQYVCYWYTADKNTRNVTPMGNYHESNGIGGLFQISFTYRHTGKLDVKLNASINTAGGMSIWNSIDLDVKNVKKNKKLIADYVAQFMINLYTI